VSSLASSLRRLPPWQVVLALAWPAVLVALLGVFIGRQDLNITDGPFVVGFAHRVLNGEIPHADFISPRPAGSAYLHTLEFLLPVPVMWASRVAMVAQVVAVSVLLAMLVLRRPFLRLGVTGAAAAVGATLVNLHTFPAMAWHTVDGMTCAALGFVLLERGFRPARDRAPGTPSVDFPTSAVGNSTLDAGAAGTPLAHPRLGLLAAGAAVLGAAPLMKQSFFVVPLLGLARLAWGAFASRRGASTPLRDRARAFLVPAVAMGGPGVLYVLLVAVGGGFERMVDELTGGRGVWGQSLTDHLKADVVGDETLRYMAIVAGLFAVAQVLRHVRPRFEWPAAAGEVAARLALTWIVVDLALRGDLLFTTPWSFQVFWLGVVVVVVSSLARRALDWPGVVIVSLGWMVSLSWGAARPALAAGSIAMYVALRAWDGWRTPERLPRLAAAAAPAAVAVAAAYLAAQTFYDVRSERTFLPERPTDALTARLGGIAPSLKGIRTGKTTAAYFNETRKCIEEHPAKWVAVIPEDALAAPAFDVRNPFPMDWLWPDEYSGPGSRERLLKAAERLGRDGDYLVLVQKATFGDIYGEGPLPMAAPGEPPRAFPFDPQLGAELLAPLKGEPITCGPFSGVYDPA
jgi:hypothetical protein